MALPPRGLEHLLVDALMRTGAREVTREGAEPGRVRARWLPDVSHGSHGSDAPPASDLHRAVEGALRAALPGVALDPRWSSFDPAPWLAARGERELRIAGLPRLVLLPGVAFGDGDHPTTRRCLELLAGVVAPGDRVADLGSGSGLLSVAAARLGARQVVAVDLDPAGPLETAANARRNGVENRVHAIRHRVAPGRLGPLDDGPWRGIVANLEGAQLIPLLPELLDRLEPGGWLLASGLHRGEREAVDRALASAGRSDQAVQAVQAVQAGVETTALDDGWMTLVLRVKAGPLDGGPPPPDGVRA